MKTALILSTMMMLFLAVGCGGPPAAESESSLLPPHPTCPVNEALCYWRYCTDTNIDPANCGGCGHVCAAGESCQSGACTCQSNDECGTGQYCQHPAGQCDQAGVCAAIPVGLCAVGPELCGCDGVTYPGPCFAAKYSASIAYAGACQ
jgi:hypothetical protein